jgi:glycosyltransferase involved in cell wall biosynthesis
MARAVGLDVVSTGPKLSNLPAEVDGAVRWRGRVEDVAHWYRQAKVLLLPSIQEGLGIVAFEALACGTPVIAWRCGGPDRFLEESGGGMIVDDAETFKVAVELLLADHARRTEMGIAGRRWVESHMAAEQFLAAHDLFTP